MVAHVRTGSSLVPATVQPRRVLSKEQRLNDIVQAATELFHEKGYEQTSVSELAERMGISIGGLYRHLKTKSDALVMVCEDIYGDLPEQLSKVAGAGTDPVERARAVLRTYLRACLDHRALILLMYREYRNLPPVAQERYKRLETTIVEQIRAVVDDGIQAGAFACQDSALFAQNVLLIGHQPALKGWLRPAGRRSASAYVDDQAGLILGGLGV